VNRRFHCVRAPAQGPTALVAQPPAAPAPERGRKNDDNDEGGEGGTGDKQSSHG
jgi:hypothetical protein